MRIIFVRHGEPDYKNDCLTENGRLQAQNTAIRLHNENIAAIYSSPMGRALETASYTAKDHGLEILPLDYMHEIDWGDANDGRSEQAEAVPFSGHPWTLGYMLLTEHPEYVGSDAWDKHHYFKDNRCMEGFEKVSRGIDSFMADKGYVGANSLYKCHRVNNETYAIFAHGGSGAAMFSRMFGLPFPFVLTSLPYGVCSVSVIAFDALEGEYAIPRFELFNDMRHIDSFKSETLHLGVAKTN